MRMLDLFCGRFGWGKAFAARGWECIGVDLIEPPEIPSGCMFEKVDILTLHALDLEQFDFICASSPCEEFSVHGMPHFHPNPKYPAIGLELFNHTRAICEASGVPYVMENVRAAQQFAGKAVSHCGPFYLWGNAVPPLLPAGITKGISHRVPGIKNLTRKEITAWRRLNDPMWSNSKSKKRQEATALAATIPPELANCVADYAERVTQLEMAV
jgi:hypothetical protein